MKGETILCVSTAAWHSLWRPIHQIMSRVAVQNRVLFFEPGRNPERSFGAELWRNLPYFFVNRSRQLTDNLVVIPSPSSVPYARQNLPESVLQMTVPLVAKANAKILARHIRKVTAELGVESSILWLHDPRHIGLAGNLGEKLVVYFNYDEYGNYVENRRIKELLERYDDSLSRRADVVFATGRAQWERRRRLNPNAYFVPNGVDFELFHSALDPGTPIPAEISELRKPIIGYAGWLGNQIDVSLLQRVAEVYQDCTLVLVGPDDIPKSEDYRRLHSMPNVRFLGRKQVSELPHYLKAFDVALIPYQLAGYVLTAYPLKLHEYLAAGRAIVSTALPELRPFSHVVRIAENHDGFLDGINAALGDSSARAVEERVATARVNTWDQRVAEIYRVLDSHLAGET